MSHRLSRRVLALAAAAVVTGTAATAYGALPLIAAGLGKQLVKNLLIDGIKSQLMGSLADLGCKGAALASVLASTGAGRLALPGGMPMLSASMPALPGGMAAMPGGLPTGLTGAMLGMPGPTSAMAMSGALGAMGSPQMMALMQQQLGARAGDMPATDSEQTAQIQVGMVAMQQAMAQPLSRTETLAVFDELGELGVMTPAMQSEARDCVMLAPPSASGTVGMAGALMKNMVLPQLRTAREEMANLQPQEREQLATEIAQAMNDMPPDDRRAFQEGFGTGFFPPDVVSAVKAKLR